MWRALILAVVVFAVGCDKGHGWQDVADNDPRLEEARAEAREKWPEFVKAFQANVPLTEYSVEVLYEEGGQSEYLMLDVLDITDTEITGAINGYPQKVDRQSGEHVTVPIENLSDWAYVTPEGEEHGRFVAEARRELERRD